MGIEIWKRKKRFTLSRYPERSQLCQEPLRLKQNYQCTMFHSTLCHSSPHQSELLGINLLIHIENVQVSQKHTQNQQILVFGVFPIMFPVLSVTLCHTLCTVMPPSLQLPVRGWQCSRRIGPTKRLRYTLFSTRLRK